MKVVVKALGLVTLFIMLGYFFSISNDPSYGPYPEKPVVPVTKEPLVIIKTVYKEQSPALWEAFWIFTTDEGRENLCFLAKSYPKDSYKFFKDNPNKKARLGTVEEHNQYFKTKCGK